MSEPSESGKAPAAYSVETLCKLLDLTERRVQQLSNEGVLIKVERGRYDLVRSVQGYVKYLRDRALRRDEADLDGWPARKIAAVAEMSEIELATLKAERVDVEDVRQLMLRVAATIRTRFMALPAKLAPLLEMLKTNAERQDIMRREIDEVLAELSNLKVPDARLADGA